MKVIPKPILKKATHLTAAEMNRIHFGGKTSDVPKASSSSPENS